MEQDHKKEAGYSQKSHLQSSRLIEKQHVFPGGNKTGVVQQMCLLLVQYNMSSCTKNCFSTPSTVIHRAYFYARNVAADNNCEKTLSYNNLSLTLRTKDTTLWKVYTVCL